MTTKTTRPSVARKVTRKTTEKQDSDLSIGARVEIDGEAYEVRVGDVMPALARELRLLTGMGFLRLLDEMRRDPDIDLISTFVWVARRIRGENVTLEECEVGYDVVGDPDRFDMAQAGVEVDEGPEA